MNMAAPRWAPESLWTTDWRPAGTRGPKPGRRGGSIKRTASGKWRAYLRIFGHPIHGISRATTEEAEADRVRLLELRASRFHVMVSAPELTEAGFTDDIDGRCVKCFGIGSMAGLVVYYIDSDSNGSLECRNDGGAWIDAP